MPSVLIRKAGLEDARAIATIHVDSWRAAYKGLLPQKVLDGLSVDSRERYWREFLTGIRESEGKAWVADEDERVVGFASTGMNRDQDLSRHAPPELFAIYLAPDAWGQGIGRELERRALDDLAERGFKCVVMWVLEGNERALGFYEKSGWKPDGAREFLEGLDAYKVRFRLPLALAP